MCLLTWIYDNRIEGSLNEQVSSHAVEVDFVVEISLHNLDIMCADIHTYPYMHTCVFMPQLTDSLEAAAGTLTEIAFHMNLILVCIKLALRIAMLIKRVKNFVNCDYFTRIFLWKCLDAKARSYSNQNLFRIYLSTLQLS